MDKKKKFDLNLEIFRDIFQICPRVYGQNFDELPTNEDIVSFFKELGHTGEIKTIADITTGLDKLRLSRAQILWGMYYKKNVDYVELLWEDFTYQIDNRGVTPPKKAQKFKKSTSPKLSTVPASPDEPTRKSKRVKRPNKKSSDTPTTGVVIRETPVKSLSNKKEKITVEKRKGIDLLSKVALTEEAHEAESWGKDGDDSNNKHDFKSGGSDQERVSGDDKAQSDSEKGSDSGHETDENESGSESNQEENEEENEDDEEQEEDEFVKTPSNDTYDEDEIKIKDKTEGDEDKGIDYATNQFNDDVNVRLNDQVDIDEGLIQKEGTDAEMTNKTEVPVTRSSHSSDLASKFLNFSDIPHTDAEIVSPMDVHVHHEVPSNQTPTLLTVPVSVITESLPIFTIVIPQSLPSFTPPPQQSTPTLPPTTKATNPPSTLPNFASVFQFDNRVTTLEKEVVELKRNDPLNTQVTALVDEHLDSVLGAIRDEFISYLSASITARITEQVNNQLPQILPK
ncbi:hypothetical protein Tco_0703897 [Tanacetum coccineum]|uniref:Uncharacterized protein n=1 Tax=Tanacetum coccineum TaxID=301880 RepID=A0ABQ4Y1M7_9ASTR